MKLVGSAVENEHRSVLKQGKRALFSGRADGRLLASIIHVYPKMTSAYILDWVPEQSEDFFTVIMDDFRIMFFEMPRETDEPAILIKEQSLADYRRGLRKNRAIKLEVALDLLSSDRRSSG